jgi:hypothetical protein
MNKKTKTIFVFLSYIIILLLSIRFLLKVYDLMYNIYYGGNINNVRVWHVVFNTLSENFEMLLWGLAISSAIMILTKIISGEKISIKSSIYEKKEEIDLLEVDDKIVEDNNRESKMDGNDFKHDEIWICSDCGTINEIYTIKCKKCNKIID